MPHTNSNTGSPGSGRSLQEAERSAPQSIDNTEKYSAT